MCVHQMASASSNSRGSVKQFGRSVQGNPVTSFLDVRPGQTIGNGLYLGASTMDPVWLGNGPNYLDGEDPLWPTFVASGEVPLKTKIKLANYPGLVEMHHDTFYKTYSPALDSAMPGVPRGRGSMGFNLTREGNPNGIGIYTPNPASLATDVKADYAKPANVKKRHKQTRDHREPGTPAPKTKNGQLIHALKRIVPGGDPETNQYFQNSVATLIAQGALRDTEMTAPVDLLTERLANTDLTFTPGTQGEPKPRPKVVTRRTKISKPPKPSSSRDTLDTWTQIL